MLNDQSTTNNNAQPLTEAESAMLETLRSINPEHQSRVIGVLEAVKIGFNMTPEQRAELMQETEEKQRQERLARRPQPTPEELEQKAIRDAWDTLPETTRLVDSSHASSLDAIEILAMHVMNQLFARQYLSKIHLYIESGLSDLHEDIMHIIQTGLDALPSGYGSELIGKGRQE
ncbi:MAG TPA: hypothetical protein VHL11_17420 [Phototrophicaceae bacterium]|jgi:hypothetical protein|nr:hypothetical protein [Phototrophicaceae bacterium]